MKRIKIIATGAGKVILALLGGILFPILIWVALGVAINHKLRERRLQRKPAPRIGEILATAGLTIHGETGTDQPVAAKTAAKQPVPEAGKLLGKARLSIHQEAIPENRSVQTERTAKQTY